ncbi:MAG TPA: hypothetical protein VL947_04415 [Cytophagales bacterium]|nr:hypothetical protein [Cytophagales bacterium]
MKKDITFLAILSMLASCDPEMETLPKKDTLKVDTSVVSIPKKSNPPVTPPDNGYSAFEIKLKNLPQVIHTNTELKKQNKEPLKTKIVDIKSDSLFSIKFGKTLDTNFIAEYEFYIHKKTKVISVYDKGEDRMITLEEWQKMNELY